VFNEELRVLVVRAVIGVGVDDQLRIRHVLLHDEGRFDFLFRVADAHIARTFIHAKSSNAELA
jgi:hypothetical protein